MIVVTGGAGFIGSQMIHFLNQKGIDDIIVVDELGSDEKWFNLRPLRFYSIFNPDEFLSEIEANRLPSIDCIFHMGACSATTERDVDYLYRNNTRYSQSLWQFCCDKKIPYIYASSAATYGDGSLGYNDDEGKLDELRPLNAYGWSKQLMDQWALKQKKAPPLWAGLKFFNVFGPGEFHKGRMSSVVLHAYRQIKKTGKVQLFESYKEGVAHGEQQRDFVYVEDVVKMMDFFRSNKAAKSGIYNIANGEANTFIDFVKPVFTALKLKENIEFIPMPEDLRGKYQYFTEGPTAKLRNIGYTEQNFPLDEAVQKYILDCLEVDERSLPG